MIVTSSPSQKKPSRPAEMVNLLRRFCGLSSGRSVHECIEEPRGLSYPTAKRAKRLMHDSKISLW